MNYTYLEFLPTATNGEVSHSVNWVILAQMESLLETVCLHNHITKQVLCVHLEPVLCYSAALIAVFVHQKYFHSRNNHGCLRSYQDKCHGLPEYCVSAV
jgi:hypothetical protein